MKTDGERKRTCDVDLRQREPLHVQHVGAPRDERAERRRACSTAFSGSRARERWKSRDESG